MSDQPSRGQSGPTLLLHNRITLALHELRAGTGRPLLILHGLGEQSPTQVPSWADAWTGPITALDFTGHGASTVPRGGGYSAELLLADADTALLHLGEATVVGRGLGAYIALLLAGARPATVHGAVLADGPGLAGGSATVAGQSVIDLVPRRTAPDPYALVELARDLRPADYATMWVRLAVQGSALEDPISVCARFRPPWLAAAAAEPGVAEVRSLAEGVARYLPA